MQLTEPHLERERVIIVNGGTQGLGEAVARKLAAEGAAGLLLTGRTRERGDALAAELSGLGTPTRFVAVDSAADDAPDTIVGACIEQFGAVHGLANVAALTLLARAADGRLRDALSLLEAGQLEPEHIEGFLNLGAGALGPTGQKGRSGSTACTRSPRHCGTRTGRFAGC